MHARGRYGKHPAHELHRVASNMSCCMGGRKRRSVAYFAHDPSHRLLPEDDDGEFTCDGCVVAGAGPRYSCSHPGCGFRIHEVCALRFPRTLKSIVHSQHRLTRRDHVEAGGGSTCEVCGEDVKGACYGCSACSPGIVVHPLCVRLPPVARGSAAAHPRGHYAWLVRKSSGGGDAAAPACGLCGRGVGPWGYRCGTCRLDVHPRCLVPAPDQCRGGEASAASKGRSCCLVSGKDLMSCLNISYYYRSST